MTIPKITPYTGEIANPDGSQTQTEFTQNMFDQLSYEAELSTELNNTVDGINNTATQVDADATSSAQSAAAAEAAAYGLNYQGLWPDTGGIANKGDTYQTQVSGTGTGQYFTALQNTTVDPVGDDVNWRSVVSNQSLGGLTSYQAASVADMIAGNTIGGAVLHKLGQVWSLGEQSWKVNSVSTPMSISNFTLISTIILKPRDWGLLIDGSDETTKWQELIAYASSNRCAIGDWLGNTLITSQLAPTAGFAGFVCNNELYNVFTKGFDGELIRSASQAAVYDGFWIKGDSSSFAGGGIYAISDDVYFGKSLRITDTQDSCIIFQGGEAAYNTVDRSFLLAGSDTPCVRSDGVDPSPQPSVRNFNKIRGGGRLPNFDGMGRATCTECFGGAPIFGSNSSKIGFHNNRITTPDDVVISGLDHNFTGNQIGLQAGKDIKITSGSVGITFDDSNRITRDGSTNVSIIDENPYGGQSINNISTVLENVLPVTSWNGSISDGDFGNSNVVGYFKREHRIGVFSFAMVRGSTAALPDGSWSITLPFNAAVTASGSCLIKPSGGGAFASGTAVVQGGSNRAFFFMQGQTSEVDKTTYSFGANAELIFSISFIIQ